MSKPDSLEKRLLKHECSYRSTRLGSGFLFIMIFAGYAILAATQAVSQGIHLFYWGMLVIFAWTWDVANIRLQHIKTIKECREIDN